MKKWLRMLLVLIFALASFSTVLAQDDEEMGECMMEMADEDMEAPDNSDFTFIIILPNPRGDRSFIDSAAAGAERAIAELGVTGLIVETAGTQEHDAAIRRAVQDEPDLIIMIAVAADTVEEIVDEFPDQLFAAQETFFAEPPEFDNLALFTIDTHENSYLAGIAVGMLTRTGVVGSVGGLDVLSINQFIVGFEEGVASVCPDCTFLRSYTGDFADPVRGKELALSMYSEGADVIYQVAGRSGEGVLEAANETGNFAIGVDSNQDDIFPGSIILSAMKRVDNAVFSFVETTLNGEFVAGSTIVGLAEGSAGLSWDDGVCSRTFDEAGPEDMVEKLPEIRAAIDEAREAILSGEIEVTNTLAPEDE